MENENQPVTLDPAKIVGSYLNQSDWRTKENSNASFSFPALVMHCSGAVNSAYWLNNVYTPEIAEAHKSAAIHIHDLSMLCGYCFSKKARFMLADGMTSMSFEEAEAQGITEADVLTWDEDKKDTIKIHAIDIGLRDTDRAVVVVNLKNGDSLPPCLYDHEFKTTLGEWKKAIDLKPADSLQGPSAFAKYDVESVVSLAEHEDVYCMNVPKYHNFLLLSEKGKAIITKNCAGWSLRQLIEEGFNGVADKTDSKPASHLSTLVNQMINFLGTMSNEWAGAQAFSSFDTYLAPFIRKDNLDDKEVQQCLQNFIYGANTSSRFGGQPVFSNLTFDLVCPDDMKDKPAIVGGKKLDFTYGDCQEEMTRINKIFLDLFMEGDASGKTFYYPIPTYNITKEFDWDSEVAQKLFELTGKYGTPYFQNFLNSDLKASDVRSMCCRLRLDKRELTKRGGGLFGSNEFTGSIGVVTLNMPRIGYLSKTENEYFQRLDQLLVIAKDSLEIKRKFLNEWLDNGLYPYTRRYLVSKFNNHFSTIGLVGMNESCVNFLKKDISTKEGLEFAEKVLDYMRSRLSDFQEETGNLYNLESTPAESTCYRLAKHDKERYPDIITAGTIAAPYYTNSSNLPVGYTDDVWKAIKHQEGLQKKYTGGTVFHSYMNEGCDDWKKVRDYIRNLCSNSILPYFTFSPTFSVCRHGHGYIKGNTNVCPKCAAEQKAEYMKQIEKLKAKIAEVEKEE